MWQVRESALGRIVVPQFVPPGAAVFCTTRDFVGRLNGGVAQTVTDAVRDTFGIESTLTTCTQVHGATVVHAHDGEAWRECDSCDALWSDRKHVTLGIKIADCLPVGVVDPAHGVIANAHSGWRGAVQGIAAKSIDAVEQATPFTAANAYAYLGPSIRGCCFEVGEEVASQFEEQYVDRSRAKPHVNLVAYTIDILRARGFADERISDSGLCTRCDDSIFHSYRRDGAGGGRNLMFVSQ